MTHPSFVGLYWIIGCTAAPDWFARPPPPDPPGCPASPGSPAAAHVARVRVEGWIAAEPTPALPALAQAGAWWRSVGVTLELVGTRTTRLDAVLGGDGPALDRQIAALPRAQADAAVLEAVVEPLRRWLRDRPASGADVDLVVVPRIASARSPVGRVAADLAGFTVAPRLVAELGHDQPDLAERLSDLLGPGLVPTAFVAADVLARLPPEEAQWVVAHEIGHALGLAHDPEPGNLMAGGFWRCRPRLRADQADQLR